MRYEMPTDLPTALGLRAAGGWQIIAGGTDIYPAQVDRPPAQQLLDISRVDGLRGIEQLDEGWRIGALTTWTDIAESALPPAFNALRQAAREVGGIQIQNVATVAGNLCNASPAADGVPPLLILDAEVELSSASGNRRVPLATFVRGNRDTALSDDEIMTAILIPSVAATSPSHFIKLGARRYLVISIVMVAAQVVTGTDGRIAQARIAVGACSASAQRLSTLESVLIGASAGADLRTRIADAALPELNPIDDIRATADYRHEAARELLQRAIEACFGAQE